MKLSVLAGVILAGLGCGISTQIKEARNFTKCEFRLESVTDLHLADVNIQKVKSLSDLSLKKSVQLLVRLHPILILL